MEREVSPPLSVRPPQAIVFPSGEIATANIIPKGPSPIGGRKIFRSFPVEVSQSRTVLSVDPVTMNWVWASTPILDMIDECIPISMRRIGSWVWAAALSNVPWPNTRIHIMLRKNQVFFQFISASFLLYISFWFLWRQLYLSTSVKNKKGVRSIQAVAQIDSMLRQAQQNGKNK
jgi:hypothetical protein